MMKVGIAGLGWWGQVLVKSVQDKSETIRFTAGCSGRKAKAQGFCDEMGIALRDGFDELLADPDLDGVVLATPHSQHAEQVVRAAAAGKHVFVEKPFALERAGAERAAAAAETAGLVLALGHNRRFLPAMHTLNALVADGSLGQPLHVEGHFSADAGRRYTPEHWRASQAESPAGGMTGLGIHTVDAMVALMGPIDQVIARSVNQTLPIDLDDTTAVLLRFATGAMGTLVTLTATPLLWRLAVYGNGGWAEMRGHEQLVIQRRDAEQEVRDFPATDIERAELEAFAAAAGGGEPYPLPLDQAVHGVAVLEAIIESARQEEPVRVEAG
jgi:predicted dehydrogenase